MPERSIGAVSKTVDPRKGVPGFESLSLRQLKMLPQGGIFFDPENRKLAFRFLGAEKMIARSARHFWLKPPHLGITSAASNPYP